MKKVIIDGVEYIPVTPEVKEEKRREYFLYPNGYDLSKWSIRNCWMVSEFHGAPFKVVEIKENEIIVSEDEVRNAWRGCIRPKDGGHYAEFLKLLGFKKDGV